MPRTGFRKRFCHVFRVKRRLRRLRDLVFRPDCDFNHYEYPQILYLLGGRGLWYEQTPRPHAHPLVSVSVRGVVDRWGLGSYVGVVCVMWGVTVCFNLAMSIGRHYIITLLNLKTFVINY